MTTVNLTQHNTTVSQAQQGVVDLDAEIISEVRKQLTFDEIPTRKEMEIAAKEITRLVLASGIKERGVDQAMIGGAPFFMSVLEFALLKIGVVPVYAFSKRESVDVTEEDGSITKRSVFLHVGFVRPFV